jgi:hypothetical protein
MLLPLQMELLELARVVDQVALGESQPAVSFLLLRSGAGTTVGDLLCFLRTASEGSTSSTSSSAAVPSRAGPHLPCAPPMAPHHQILEVLCVGHALVRVSMTSLEGAHALLNTCLASADIVTRFQLQPHFDSEEEPSTAALSGAQQQQREWGEWVVKAAGGRRLAGEKDEEEWVRVSREEVRGAALGEGAWDDGEGVCGGNESAGTWARGSGAAADVLPLPSAVPVERDESWTWSDCPSEEEEGRCGGVRGGVGVFAATSSSSSSSAVSDKWSSAFQHAVGMGRDLPAPTQAMTVVAEDRSSVVGARDQHSNQPRQHKNKEQQHNKKKEEEREDRVVNAFSVLLLDDDDDDDEEEEEEEEDRDT